jgi:bis(5'-adenosyl)-triphosphatase
MVIPKEYRRRVADMTRIELVDMVLAAQRVSSVLEKHFSCTSLNFGIQDGPEAGQSVNVT